MSKNINVPQLRFREFSGEWEEKKLGDIATKIGSGNTPLGGEKVYTEEGVLFIRSQNVNNDKLELSDKTFIPIEIHNKMKSSKVSSSDVLLNITGASIGRSCVVPDNIVEANVNQHVCIVRGDKTLNSNFLQTFISSFKGQKLISQGQTGSGREGLNFQSIASFKLNLPDIKEQEKIASFLTSVDTKIEQLTKKETLLQEYKKGVMAQIFSRKIRFKDDDGSEFSEWEEKCLSELVEFSNGKAHENDINENGNYIVVNSKFISSNGTIKKYANFQISPLNKNDIVMVMSDVPNGKALSKCYLIEKDNKYTLNQRICSLRQTTNNNKFLIYLVNRNKYYLAFDSGVGQTNLRKNEVLNLKLNIPCLEEQTKIANFLSSIDTKISQNKKTLEETQKFKKALLQQMFV